MILRIHTSRALFVKILPPEIFRMLFFWHGQVDQMNPSFYNFQRLFLFYIEIILLDGVKRRPLKLILITGDFFRIAAYSTWGIFVLY
jgi:hypothetical protein